MLHIFAPLPVYVNGFGKLAHRISRVTGLSGPWIKLVDVSVTKSQLFSSTLFENPDGQHVSSAFFSHIRDCFLHMWLNLKAWNQKDRNGVEEVFTSPNGCWNVFWSMLIVPRNKPIFFHELFLEVCWFLLECYDLYSLVTLVTFPKFHPSGFSISTMWRLSMEIFFYIALT